MNSALWIFMFLCTGLPGRYGLTSFPDHLVVVRLNQAVTLRCRAASHQSPVRWTLDGNHGDEPLEGEHYRAEGPDLALSGFDLPMAGVYRCWEGDRELDSTHVLLDATQDEEGEERTDSFLSCRAKSYDCSFTCHWDNSRSEFTAARLGLGSACSENKASCSWLRPENSQGAAEEEGFNFTLSHSLSAHSEESAALLVTFEAINSESGLYLRETKQFYLRDIVRPDSPERVTCQVEKQSLRVTVEPPPTWATPLSFYPLEHQIEYLYKDNGKVGSSTSDLVPRQIARLRVRSRDPLVPSAWSEWSPWKNVQKDKKKGGGGKHTDNRLRCRPRVTSTGQGRRTKPRARL